MSISEKIKAMNNNIEKDKAQYKIFVLSSENVRKYDFLTSKNVLPEKDLLEEAATLKWFEYSSLGKAFEKQTNVIKKTDWGYWKERRQKN